MLDGIWEVLSSCLFFFFTVTTNLKISPSLLFGHPRWTHARMRPRQHTAPSLPLGGSRMQCWLFGCQLPRTLRWQHSAGTAWSTPWPAAEGDDVLSHKNTGATLINVIFMEKRNKCTPKIHPQESIVCLSQIVYSDCSVSDSSPQQFIVFLSKITNLEITWKLCTLS